VAKWGGPCGPARGLLKKCGAGCLFQPAGPLRPAHITRSPRGPSMDGASWPA